MNRYTIGGVAFAVHEVLPDLDTGGFSDLEVAARFASAPEAGGQLSERTVAGPAGLSGTVDPDARSCRLPDRYPDPEDRAWQLRQMAPIFSNVLNRLVLHAGAVETDAGILGFIGESGTGKSTITRCLAGRGHGVAADDLLPVRFTPDPSAPLPRHISIASVGATPRT